MLSRKAHRELTRVLKQSDLRTALAAYLKRQAPKARRSGLSAYSAQKAKARAEKNAETAAIRAACEERARDRCEGCGRMYFFGDPELDHFFGRAKGQSVETCWMLCGRCHRAKTNNDPSAAFWNLRWKAFCEKHGYVYRGRIEHQPSVGAAGRESFSIAEPTKGEG